jgi:putative copper export protein
LDLALVITRFAHIVSGSFWAGAAIYLALLLEPRIRSGPPDLERQLLSRTSRLNSLWITGAAVVTIVTGFALVAMTPERSMSDLGEDGWGVMILVGLLASLAAFFVSGFAGMATAKLRRFVESAGADAGANPGTERQLANFRRRLSLLGYLNAVLVVVAIGSMATARFA